MQGILYKSEENRTPISILRLYNQSFQHAMILNEVIKNTISLTKRKMFGQYYHALTVHAPDQYRLFSGPTTNTALKLKVESTNGSTKIVQLSTLSFAKLINEPEDDADMDIDLTAEYASPSTSTYEVPFISIPDTPIQAKVSNFMTSTPIAEKAVTIHGTPTGLSRKNSNNIITIVKKEIPATDQGNTARLVEKVLGPCDVIVQYNHLRKLYKSSPHMYEMDLKRLSAQLEIKLATARDNLKDEIKKIEREQLAQNRSMSIIGDEIKSEYDGKLKKLSILQKLNCHFDI